MAGIAARAGLCVAHAAAVVKGGVLAHISTCCWTYQTEPVVLWKD